MLSVERIPIFIAALSTASLLAGVLFDIGYFSSVGFQYVYYLTIQDHIESAVIWAPTIILTAIGVYFSGFTGGAYGGITVGVTAKKVGRLHRFVVWFLQQTPLLIGNISFLLAGAISIAAYGIQDISILIIIAVIFVVGLVARWGFSVLGVFLIFPRIPALAALALLLGGLLFYFGGYWGSKDISNSKLNPSIFEFEDGSKYLLGVVRPIEKGVIVFDDKDGNVSFVRMEKIVRISTPKSLAKLPEAAPFDFRKFVNSITESW